jgi:hypothetical protein
VGAPPARRFFGTEKSPSTKFVACATMNCPKLPTRSAPASAAAQRTRMRCGWQGTRREDCAPARLRVRYALAQLYPLLHVHRTSAIRPYNAPRSLVRSWAPKELVGSGEKRIMGSYRGHEVGREPDAGATGFVPSIQVFNNRTLIFAPGYDISRAISIPVLLDAGLG